ncbi:alpha/beta hydrolase domain-containing protein VTE7-like [Malania oleifera]|uniref:alpha/beta hydrolase domain-containing protein VTE7-like n=1 Tax=Malania oleifera TaxID=397392 RepID=UPI0025ADBA42|nr:alpha/beta hydrolase domain-containing protein VTE7-like [Malania oleifera]
MALILTGGSSLAGLGSTTAKCRNRSPFRVFATEFPPFLPKEVERIKDPFARKLAKRIERLPVQVTFSERCIMSSCVKPFVQSVMSPVVLLHGFDSSCLEWRYMYPLLEEAGLETWAVDILGWGFSDLERLPSCDVTSKRDHLYQFWKFYIKKPMMLVGPSLGAAVAIDFAANHPDAVDKLVLIDASVYTEGTGNLAKLPRIAAYAGAYLLKSIPVRFYANRLAFNGISFSSRLDWTNVGRLHCLLPWWEDATVDFMISGGYNVSSQIEKVKQRTLGRDAAKNMSLKKHLDRTKQRIWIDIPPGYTASLNDWCTSWTWELGIICRQYAPVTTFSWPQVTQKQCMVLCMCILHDPDTSAEELLPDLYLRTHQRRLEEWCEGA